MEDRQDHQRGFTFDSKLAAGKFNFSNHTLKIMWIKLQTNFRRFECEFFSISNAIDFTWSVVVIETGRYFDRSITAVSRRRSRSHNTGNDHIISCSLPTEHRCVCVINDPIFAKNKQSTLSLFFFRWIGWCYCCRVTGHCLSYRCGNMAPMAKSAKA